MLHHLSILLLLCLPWESNLEGLMAKMAWISAPEVNAWEQVCKRKSVYNTVSRIE